MSGIYGIWYPFNQEEYDKKELGKLKSWNKAYGTQGADVWADDTCYIGCFVEKLRESASHSAPVLVSKDYYAVLDVVLYNREELLKKGNFDENLSDEELLLKYIITFGYQKLQEINGDFAGAVYDIQKKQVTLFRDHMGVRPLFYYTKGKNLVFSTDIRGIISMHSTDVAVSEKWLWSKLSSGAYPGTENTEFSHVFCVKPASYMTFSVISNDLLFEKKTYWKLGAKKIRLSSETEYIKHLRELITDSVNCRLNAVSGLVAGELSGGLDSGVIDILIHRLGRKAAYFSWSASPEKVPYAENDERLVIKDICDKENIICDYSEKFINIEKDSIMYQKVCAVGMEPEMEAGLYRRFVLPPYITTLQIAKAAQYANNQGSKVVFTGHGGDEAASHRCNPYELFFYKEYWHYFKYMWESTKGEKHRIYSTILRCHKNLSVSRKKLVSPFVSVFASKEMLQKEFYEKYYTKAGVSNTFAYDPIAYIQNGGSRNRLDVVALLGAYGGARYMIPYLDYRVVDYAVSIPRNMFLKHGKDRYIFREAFKNIMPESLYKLTGKEDTSWKNVKKKERDARESLERKQNLVEMLDRDYFKDYLDWDTLEQWARTPVESADGNFDQAMLGGIGACLNLQDVIVYSRAIEPKDD